MITAKAMILPFVATPWFNGVAAFAPDSDYFEMGRYE